MISAVFVLSGCSQPYFSGLPKAPSSITITKYQASNKENQTTYTLTGKKMDTLYRAIEEDAKHVLPKNAVLSCPTYSSDTVVWDYHIVIHFPNKEDSSYSQTTAGCTFVKDEQTNATALGSLPGLNPLQISSK